MSTVGLLFSGATLFLNSLVLLKKADAKAIAIFNLFVGLLQVIVPFYLLTTTPNNDPWAIFNTSAIFLFGFTYLYVGLTTLMNLNGNGLGWYSIWVSIMAVAYSLVYFIHFHDILNGVIWLMWAYLWYLFFASLVLNKKIDHHVGCVAFIQSWTTLTIPAFLSLVGIWQNQTLINAWYIILAISIGYFIVNEIKLKKTAK